MTVSNSYCFSTLKFSKCFIWEPVKWQSGNTIKNEELLKNAFLEHVKGFKAPLGSGLKSQNALLHLFTLLLTERLSDKFKMGAV